jgi:hypothetical protein
MMPADFASVEMNASRSSLGAVVENDGDVMLEAELDLSVDLTWSMSMAAHAGAMAATVRNKPRARWTARLTDEIVFTFSTELIFRSTPSVRRNFVLPIVPVAAQNYGEILSDIGVQRKFGLKNNAIILPSRPIATIYRSEHH